MNLFDLSPRVMAEAPGVTEAEAKYALHEAARDFCRTTGAWRIKATAFTITSATTYTLAGLGTGVVGCTVVEILDANDNAVSMDTYRLVADDTATNIVFDDLPEAGTVLTAELEVEPLISYTGTMGGLAFRYQRALIAGAVHRFCVDSKHPAFNPPKADDALFDYNRGMSSATHALASRGHRGSMLMEGRDWL